MSRLVSRDPFAREELHSKRQYVYSDASTCRFCGDVRRTFRGKRFLMSYFIESDSGRRSDVRGLFCSVSCMRSHHG